MSKYGHVLGTKQERPRSTEWYRDLEDANIRRVEATWQPQPLPPQDEEDAA